MKKHYLWICLIVLNLVPSPGKGQIRSIPAAVTDTFRKMFPAAEHVEWRDKITDFAAFFSINNLKCEAKFTLNGDWISTERSLRPDSLPAAVKEGLRLSKYADWKTISSYILLFPGDTIQYHLVVTKNQLERKILSFDRTGQLLTDHLAL